MIKKEILTSPISALNLSYRSNRCLEKAGIKTLQDFVKLTRTDVLSLPTLGIKSLNELEDFLFENDLHLGMTDVEIRRKMGLDESVDDKTVVLSVADLEMLLYKWHELWLQKYEEQQKEIDRLKAIVEDEQMLTANEVSEKFNITRDIIYRWRRIGWLDGMKDGIKGAYQYKVKDVKALMYIKDHDMLKKLKGEHGDDQEFDIDSDCGWLVDEAESE